MSDDYERFLDLVQQLAHRSREDAERAARATLQTLAERISAGQARDLAEQLPPELAPWIATTGDAEAFDVDEFLRRVAEREGAEVARAERDARAVFAALGRSVRRRKEIDDLVSELPRSFGPLLDEAQGRFVHVVSAETFLAKVADRAGLDPAGARRAADAVLETLKRGDALSQGAARRMPVEQFVLHVAEREGVTPGDALRHARAVFATLREAVPEQEFLDVTAQLPRDYAALEARS